jgi:CBS domain-containing protein
MQAQDVMTTPVVTVHPDTPLKEIAKTMIERRIGGIPVVDARGTLVGIVTDGDLFRRAELGTEKQRDGGWLEMFTAGVQSAEDYVAARARVASEIMTTDVIAVAPETPLRQIADLFETKRIRRVPVVKDGVLVGIVSRANLVQAFAALSSQERDDRLADRRIRDLVLAEYARLPWGPRSEHNVIVTNGVLHLYGLVSFESEATALRVAAEAIPGVKGFVDHTVRLFGEIAAPPRKRSTVTVIGPEQGS